MPSFKLASLMMLPLSVYASSLMSVVQQTIETHPQIKVKKEELNVQKEVLRQVKSDNLPVIDLSYGVGPETTNTVANSTKEAKLIRQDASAELSQNVFAGFDTIHGIKQQKALILSAGNGVSESANAIALEVIDAYLNVLKTKELYDIANENVEVHKKYLAQIKKKVDAGVQRHSDYQQTLSRLENAQSVAYLSQQNYENALFSFKRILPVKMGINDFEEPTIANLPANDIDKLVQLALKNNPTIKVKQADIKAAKEAVKRAGAPFLPRADIKAQAYWNDNLNGIGYDNPDIPGHPMYTENRGYNALLVFNYNIFNGMADSAAKQSKEHEFLKQNADFEDKKRYIKANTQIAYKTYTLLDEQLKYITKNVEASKKTVSDYRRENDLGRRSIIDLLNIELEYNSARNRQATAKYDKYLAYYQLLSYTGSLLGQMKVTIK